VKLWRKLVEGHPKDSQARIFLAEVVKDGFDDKGEPRAGEEEALTIFQSEGRARKLGRESLLYP
jgi:hypothetical protein